MNKKLVVALAALGFALFLGGSVWLYGALSAGQAPKIPLKVAEGQGEVKTPGSGAPAAESGEVGSGETPAVRMLAPDFTVQDADGNETKLSDHFGKPLVVNFWASWCPPCRAEMPDFETVYQELGGEVTFMMVDMVSARETVESGQNYISEQGFTFPVYYDVVGQAAAAYGISAIPTSLFIDENGYLIAGAEGMIDLETLRYGISYVRENVAESSE